MDSQLNPGFVPISARNAHSLPVRQYSLPTYKHRANTKIKINIKRLPNDFFQSPSSVADITPLSDILGKFRAKTQDTNRARTCKADPGSLEKIERKAESLLQKSKFKAIVSKTEKVSRGHRSNIGSEQLLQNNNTMNFNLTFSKQLFSNPKDDNFQTLTRKYTPSDILDSSRTMIAKIKQNSIQLKGDNPRPKPRTEMISDLLGDKIAELNLNRLKKNIRKNNHPQPYLQYIKNKCA